jgi:hypothetical protein
LTREAVPKLQLWNSNLEIRSFARLKAYRDLLTLLKPLGIEE